MDLTKQVFYKNYVDKVFLYTKQLITKEQFNKEREVFLRKLFQWRKKYV